jgi:DNA-binding response OmpR family regulator
MSDVAKILIADDDPDYCRVTARFLSGEGYGCTCVVDAAAAESELSAGEFDLLISDIEMPGNEHLALITRAAEIAPGMPVILATGYPSIDTAIESMRLSVFTYLLKPLDYPELANQVRKALERYRMFRIVKASEQRVADWMSNLSTFEDRLQTSHSSSLDIDLRSFVTMAFSNMIGAMRELKTLIDFAYLGDSGASPCRILQCPVKEQFETVMRGAIEALRDTKGAFKSKEIADLRRKFERLLEEDQRQLGRPSE